MSKPDDASMSKIIKYDEENVCLSADQTFALLQEQGLYNLDIRCSIAVSHTSVQIWRSVFRILEKHVRREREDQPLLVWRHQYFILLMEQIKLVCFPDYCIVLNHLNNVKVKRNNPETCFSVQMNGRFIEVLEEDLKTGQNFDEILDDKKNWLSS